MWCGWPLLLVILVGFAASSPPLAAIDNSSTATSAVIPSSATEENDEASSATTTHLDITTAIAADEETTIAPEGSDKSQSESSMDLKTKEANATSTLEKMVLNSKDGGVMKEKISSLEGEMMVIAEARSVMSNGIPATAEKDRDNRKVKDPRSTSPLLISGMEKTASALNGARKSISLLELDGKMMEDLMSEVREEESESDMEMVERSAFGEHHQLAGDEDKETASGDSYQANHRRGLSIQEPNKSKSSFTSDLNAIARQSKFATAPPPTRFKDYDMMMAKLPVKDASITGRKEPLNVVFVFPQARNESRKRELEVVLVFPQNKSDAGTNNHDAVADDDKEKQASEREEVRTHVSGRKEPTEHRRNIYRKYANKYAGVRGPIPQSLQRTDSRPKLRRTTVSPVKNLDSDPLQTDSSEAQGVSVAAPKPSPIHTQPIVVPDLPSRVRQAGGREEAAVSEHMQLERDVKSGRGRQRARLPPSTPVGIPLSAPVPLQRESSPPASRLPAKEVAPVEPLAALGPSGLPFDLKRTRDRKRPVQAPPSGQDVNDTRRLKLAALQGMVVQQLLSVQKELNDRQERERPRTESEGGSGSQEDVSERIPSRVASLSRQRGLRAPHHKAPPSGDKRELTRNKLSRKTLNKEGLSARKAVKLSPSAERETNHRANRYSPSSTMSTMDPRGTAGATDEHSGRGASIPHSRRRTDSGTTGAFSSMKKDEAFRPSPNDPVTSASRESEPDEILVAARRDRSAFRATAPENGFLPSVPGAPQIVGPIPQGYGQTLRGVPVQLDLPRAEPPGLFHSAWFAPSHGLTPPTA